MKFRELVRFEIAFQLQRPIAWVFLGSLIALSWFVAAGMLVGEAERAGDLYANGPAGLTMGSIVISMLGLMVSAALFSDAALRDFESRTHPLFATSPISKLDYLGGRFVGTLIVNVLFLTSVPLALMLFMRPPFVSQELLGPFRAAAYFQPYLVMLLPNCLFAAAVLFSVAVLTRRSLPVFAIAAFLFFGALLAEEVVAGQLGFARLGAILDPFGFVAQTEQWEFWTTHEKNTRLLHVDASTVWNRIAWTGVTVALLAFTWWRFRMEVVTAGRKRRHAVEERVERPYAPVSVSPVKGTFDSRTRIRQLIAIAGQSARELLISRDFFMISALLAIGVLTLGSVSISDNFGTPFWPLTQFIAPFLGGFLPALTVILLTTFFAGELIHRERGAGVADLADVSPVPDTVLYAGKFAALVMIVATLQAVLMASGLLLQVVGDYVNFEVGLYLQILFGLKLADYLLFAALAMLVHVVLDNKYLGHLVVVICYLFTVFAGRFGLHHNLLLYGSDSGWVYSDVSGFGPFLGPVLWFKLYWAGWALLLAMAAALMWVRGHDRGIAARLALARLRFGRAAAIITASALLVVLVVGAYIFYNTNVLARYRTPFEAAQRTADYELRYRKYAAAPQPTVSGTKLHIEIYPERRVADVRGTYALVNATGTPVRIIHLFLNPAVENRLVSFDRQNRTVIEDRELGHHAYELERPLAAGESLQMTFDVRFELRGFSNADPNTSVVQNGTYFDHNGGRRVNHRRWLPLIGYQASRELTVARVRRRHGLSARPLERSVDEPGSADNAPGRETITFEAVIGTSAEQTAVAPGTLLRSWSDKGRNYFHYATERPIKNSFAIFSADYAVHRETWNGVLVELFYHPTHTFNVQRFARSVRASLDYHTKHFGPYPHPQIRIAEFPRYANFAHAYPGTIAHAEATGWVTKVDESRHFDLPSMTVAHEISHQWWGFQVMPAAAEGGPMVSEVLCQYSALMVIEKLYGTEMVERFLWNTRIEYLNRRGNPEHPEVPLLLVTAHANLVYRKGPLAMYALKEYIGEEPLNRALRRIVERYGSGKPPFATSRDLFGELQAVTPTQYHYVLEDLLGTITLWNLRTTAVSAERAGNDAWRVTLDVEAQKVRADGIGKETEVSMNDFVEIGVFGTPNGSSDDDATLYLQKHRIRSGRQQIVVLVKGTPATAGIDPRLLLIDRNWNDNARPVKTGPSAASQKRPS